MLSDMMTQSPACCITAFCAQEVASDVAVMLADHMERCCRCSEGCNGVPVEVFETSYTGT